MFKYLNRMKNGEHVVIVCIGDSITEVNDSTHGKHNYCGLLGLKLLERFGRVFTMVNVGVSENSTDDVLARLDRDVIRHCPDFVTVMIGMNDAVKGQENLDNYKCNLKQILERIQNIGAEVLLLTPNPLSFEIEDNYQRRSFYPRYVDEIRQIADELHVPLCDIYRIWEDDVSTENVCKKTYNYWRLMDDHIHPNESGHALIAKSIFEFLGI